MNPIALGRKAIRKALKQGTILRDVSAMHRVALEGTGKPATPFDNAMAFEAAKDVLLT
jgi:hypothetical protein